MLIRCQTIVPFFTNVATDVFTNTTHWEGSDAISLATHADVIAARLAVFYDDAYDGNVYKAQYCVWTAARIEVYNLADPPPRVPEVRSLGLVGSGAVSAIPTEVACVLSYHAAPESGVVRQRLHNRFYLGGLSTAAMTVGGINAFPTLTPGFVTTVAGAAVALLGANDEFISWKQFSDAGGVPIAREIVGGWVDNSPDTQRRRSVLAASRTTWS